MKAVSTRYGVAVIDLVGEEPKQAEITVCVDGHSALQLDRNQFNDLLEAMNEFKNLANRSYYSHGSKLEEEF